MGGFGHGGGFPCIMQVCIQKVLDFIFGESYSNTALAYGTAASADTVYIKGMGKGKNWC